jgi:hypothetical protein
VCALVGLLIDGPWPMGGGCAGVVAEQAGNTMNVPICTAVWLVALLALPHEGLDDDLARKIKTFDGKQKVVDFLDRTVATSVMMTPQPSGPSSPSAPPPSSQPLADHEPPIIEAHASILDTMDF